MATSLNPPASGNDAKSSAFPLLPRWTREPLLHFVLLGALLFGIDHLIAGRVDDPHRIVLGPDVDAQASDVFAKARGRAPTHEELQALRRVWLDNEVLYREGLAMQVDKGDPAIRERVIFKSLSVIDANVRLPAIDDAGLRAWFNARRDKYDEPARYDFQEAVLSGAASEADVRSFTAALNRGTPGDAQAGLRVYQGRPHDTIAQSFGDGFASALESATRGEWEAMSTRDGWRAIRLETITPPRPAEFEALRAVILQDWKDATASDQRSVAVRELAKKYTLRLEAVAP